MKTRKISIWGLALALTALQFTTHKLRGDETVPTVPQPAGEIAGAAAPATPPIVLSSGAAEIAKLAQAGLNEPTMLSYVNNWRSKFNLGSDQIIYLNDLGVSSEVVKAMIERDSALDVASAQAAANLSQTQTPPQYPLTTNPPPPLDTTDPGPVPSDFGYTEPVNDVDYFYDSLQPYGSWTFVPGCGLCWQPTLCLSNPEWRPYCDRGRWIDSDCGWYWQSDYSWGWAAFHYGRWFHDANHGWLWAPEKQWGPAWVSWRHSGDISGWAPLPPAARFVPGTGMVFGNHAVRANFDFNLQPSAYTFIPTARLSDYTPSRYAVSSAQAAQIFGQTTVANHFATENNHVVNHSIDPRTVTALAGVEIRHAEVREMAAVAGGMQTDRLAKSGGATVILRPQLPRPTTGRLVAPSASRSVTVPFSPNHSFVQPRTSSSLGTLHYQASPMYFSGSSPLPRENYPRGSLVVIGQSSTVASMRSSSGGSPYHVYDNGRLVAPDAGQNAASSRTEALAHAEGVMHDFQGRAASGRSEAWAGYSGQAARTESHGGWQGEARSQGQSQSQPHFESHAEFHSESHAQSVSSSGGGGHSSSASSSSSGNSSNSGHH